MSFSSEAKDQLMRVTMTGDEVLNAELTGALMTSGSLAWRGQRRFSMTLTNENAAVTVEDGITYVRFTLGRAGETV